MNKWEDTLKKKLIINDSNSTCYCSDDRGLFVPNRLLSAIVAGLLLFLFSVFMTGYFLGKKKAIEQFMHSVQQDNFSDHIYTTIIATEPQQSNQKTSPHALPVTDEDAVNLPIKINQNSANFNEKLVVETHQNQRHYAQLIGFITEKAAQIFSKKMSDKGIETEVKKRVSKSAKGRVSSWYQVVTTLYSDKDELLALVNRLTNEENIKDACIQSVLITQSTR